METKLSFILDFIGLLILVHLAIIRAQNDVENPQFTFCPSNISANYDDGVLTAAVSWSVPTYTDNVGVTNVVSSHNPGDVFNEGATQVDYGIADAAGNSAFCSFFVIVGDFEPPTINNCPNFILQSTLSTTNYTIAFWRVPTATDRFTPVTMVASHQPLDRFYIGETIVTHTFTDSNGNSDACVFSVFVQDNVSPIVSDCPSNITTGPDPGEVTANVTWTEPTATDNSNFVNVTSSHTPPADISGGLTEVVYLFADNSGNVAPCTFFILVTDDVPPTFTSCPTGPIEGTTDPGLPTGSVTWNIPTATDNTVPPTVTSMYSPGDNFTIGDTEVMYVARDAFQLTAICSFMVVISDEERPVFTDCPGAVQVDAVDSDSAVATWIVPSVTDNSGPVMFTPSHSSGSLFTLGSTSVTYISTDPSGNSAACTFVVIVNDVSPPTFTVCPNDTSIVAPPGFSVVTITWVTPVATDASGQPVVVSTHSSGGSFGIGDTNVTYTASDSSGNEGVCTFTVTVIDQEEPVITGCPANMFLTVGSNNPNDVAERQRSNLQVSWTIPSFTDNAAVVNVFASQFSGATFEIGVTEVVYIATDSSGNIAVCSFNVTVSDVQNPSFTICPSDLDLDTDVGESYSTGIWAEPQATDNDGVPTITSNYNPGDLFPLGVTTVMYIASDSSGNQDECTFNITVADNERPTFSECPQNIIQAQDVNQLYATVNWTIPVAMDNVNITIYSESHTPLSQFQLGTTFVQYITMDAAKNIALCQFTITVVDETPPTVRKCPNMLLQSTTPGENYQSIFWREPFANGPGSELVTTTQTHMPFDNFFIGVTVVTYTFTDPSGNSANCSFNVIIQDNELPVITGCPGNLTLGPQQGSLNATVNWTEPVITDNSHSPIITQTHVPPIQIEPGYTQVIYQVSDSSGNMAMCSFTISNTDREGPVFTFCPGDQTVDVPPGLSVAAVNWTEPTATDNSLPPTITTTHTSGQNFTIGTQEVTYTATDAFGMVTTCQFTVVVNDPEAPTFDSCPSDTNVTLPSVSADVLIRWSEPVATDNSNQVMMVGTHANNATYPLGVFVVTYTATDGSGNEDMCSFVVRVTDVTPPTFTLCPANVTANTTLGLDIGFATWPTPQASDNAGQPLVTTSHMPGNFTIGAFQVVYRATDMSGNEGGCDFFVFVEDNEPPVIESCPSDFVVNLPSDSNMATVSWSTPVFSDNSGMVSTVSSLMTGLSLAVGNYSVNKTATDPSGNVAVCAFTFEVQDVTPPVLINCPSNISQPTDTNQPTATVRWTMPTAEDNDGIVSIVSSEPVGSQFPVGAREVIYTAEDNSGHTTTCSFSVTVFDQEAPQVRFCTSDIIITLGQNESAQFVNWTEPVFTDNFQMDSINGTYLDGAGTFSYGTYSVLYFARDTFGNEAYCNFSITVQDLTNPTVVCPTSPIVVDNERNSSFAYVNWTAPTVSDNSGIASSRSDANPGDMFVIGNTTVTFSATDVAGNRQACFFIVSVVDVEPPQFVRCPEDITEVLDVGLAQREVTWETLRATDNYLEPNISGTAISGQNFSIGNTTVTFTATDSVFLTDVCTFVVTVLDEEQPLFDDCPADVYVVVNPGTASAPAFWNPPNATDNSKNVSVTSNRQPGETFMLGQSMVRYTATDGSGNERICAFQVVVTDDEPPMFVVCPSMWEALTDPGVGFTTLNFSIVNATDNVEPPLIFTDQPDDRVHVGETVVTFTASDTSNNNATCVVTVRVFDIEPPMFRNCPESVFSNDTNEIRWERLRAFDNAGLTQGLMSDYPSGSIFPSGTTLVTYTVQDLSRNNGSCSFNVTLDASSLPIVENCENNTYAFIEPGERLLSVFWEEPRAVDALSLMPVLPSSVSASPGDNFTLGITPVRYVFTDDNGFTFVCIFDVVVMEAEDVREPEFENCPENVTALAPLGANRTEVYWTPLRAIDNSGEEPVIDGDARPGSEFYVGVTNVTISAEDSSNNTALCIFEVIVIADEVPVYDQCPSDIQLDTEAGEAYASAGWTEPVFTDESGVVFSSVMYAPGDRFYAGVTNVTYKAEDKSGNTAVCVFSVTVSDNEDPTFTFCPGNQTAYIPASQSPVSISWTSPIAEDNLGTEDLTVTTNYEPGDRLPIGVNTVLYTATDEAGNSADCTFTIDVIEDTPPVFDTCPSDITINNNPMEGVGFANWTDPEVSDDRGTPTVTSSRPPGSNFRIGTKTVFYTARDLVGSVATCNFSVTVNDVEDPIFMNCTSPVTRYVVDIADIAHLFFDEPTATDNSGEEPLVTGSHMLGMLMGVGTQSASYTATDDAGNTETCVFTINVQVASSFENRNGSITVSKVRGVEAPFTATTGFGQLLEEDLDAIYRRETNDFYGIDIYEVSIDNRGNANALFQIRMKTGSDVTDSQLETIFQDQLTGERGSEFETNNTIPSIGDFFIGEDAVCDPNPCSNGGVCNRVSLTTQECDCPAEWMGALCRIDVNECNLDMCRPDQECLNLAGGYVCQCPAGESDDGGECVASKSFTGNFALTEIDGDEAVFTRDLMDETSDAYQGLSNRVEDSLTTTYGDSSGFQEARVIGFGSGSIIVYFALLFSENTAMTADSISSRLNGSIDNMGELNGNDGLFIDPTRISLTPEVCPAEYCLNGGSCYVGANFESVCICVEPYIGSRCEAESLIIPIYVIALGALAVFLAIVCICLCCLCCYSASKRRQQVLSAAAKSRSLSPPSLWDVEEQPVIVYPAIDVPAYGSGRFSYRPPRRKSRKSRSRRTKRRRRRSEAMCDVYDGLEEIRRRRLLQEECQVLFGQDHGLQQNNLYPNLPTANPPPMAHTNASATAPEMPPSHAPQAAAHAPTVTFQTPPYVATGEEALRLHERRNGHMQSGFF